MNDTSKTKQRAMKSVLSFMFKKDNTGCYEKRQKLESEGKEIPTHSFMSEVPESTFVNMDYKTALTLLNYHNVGNRKPMKATVDAYTCDILDNDFSLTGDSVTINKNGGLENGQHRLAAVVQANEHIANELGVTIENLPEDNQVTIPLLLAWGLPPNTIKKTDMGKSRTKTNLSKILGMDMQVQAQSKKLVKSLERYSYKKVVSVRDQKAVIDELGSKFIPVIDLLRNGVNGHKYGPVKDALCEFACHYPEKAKEFTEKLVTGTDLQEGNPVLLLRNHILGWAAKAGYRGGSTPSRILYSKTINAVFKWMNGETLKRLDEYKFRKPDWDSLSQS